jgi:hypothetical protein
VGGGTPKPKKTQAEMVGESAQAAQRLRDIRREDRRKNAVRTRQAGRLALLGGSEGRRTVGGGIVPQAVPGGGPQPAAAGY